VDRKEFKQIIKDVIKPGIKVVIFVLLYGWLCREFIL
tara:strand:- start:1426 stop:1536 length:111 start_codon:yes stop_codon:yes gene_type:complete